ncbi:MAG TPA: hypothetical protein VMV10_07400 [Pirellulales bacterium]|nr:hypothetical protein [Pirellulales bacterium]
MKRRIWAVVVVAAALPPAAGCAPVEAQVPKRADDIRITSAVVRQLLASDEKERPDAVERIRNDYRKGSDATRDGIEVDLILVIATLSNQTRRSGAVRSAMTLAGELRMERTVKYLVAFVAFPYQRPRFTSADELELYIPFEEPGSALGCGPIDTEFARMPIRRACPAVSALIQMGDAAIDPVARELVSTRNVYRRRCCLKVLKELEKDHPQARAAIAKAVDKAWSESDAKRIARYARRLDENPEIALFADEWDK